MEIKTVKIDTSALDDAQDPALVPGPDPGPRGGQRGGAGAPKRAWIETLVQDWWNSSGGTITM